MSSLRIVLSIVVGGCGSRWPFVVIWPWPLAFEWPWLARMWLWLLGWLVCLAVNLRVPWDTGLDSTFNPLSGEVG